MTAIEPTLTTLSNLIRPALGADFDTGKFGGVITLTNGKEVAVVLLLESTKCMTWHDAMDWAKGIGGQLPSRAVASLLVSNLNGEFWEHWHWTSEIYKSNDRSAWEYYSDGSVASSDMKEYRVARAVRLIHISD
jgi:hypothetical protein